MKSRSKSPGTMPCTHKPYGNRDGHKTNHLQQQLFTEGVVSRKILDAVPNPLLIIDERWQVVYANPAVRTLVDSSGTESKTGLTEGEAFHCVHARHSLNEAGKHACCRICGVAKALSRSLKGDEVSDDCHLTCGLSGTGAPLDVRVWAAPLEFHGHHFSILSLVDISDKRRREALEKICFHDLLNTLTCIKGVLSVMKGEDVEDQAGLCAMLERMTLGSIDEITTLRLLEQAKQKELKIHLETLESGAFLDLMQKTLQSHPMAEGKHLKIAEGRLERSFETDRQLLSRIVGNMTINALEATETGGCVTLGCQAADSGLGFSVHNDRHIPHAVQQQIFQHNASTKGHGRGMGTYSIKLLSEVLGGEASFRSSEAEGTTFSLLLPVQSIG